MSSLSFGDLAQAFAQKSRISNLKSQSLRLQAELSTGQKGDLAKHLSGATDGLAAMERSRELAAGYLKLSKDFAIRSDIRQNALAVISTGLEGLGQTLATLTENTSPNDRERMATSAKAAFAEAIAALNTDVTGRAIFAGTRHNGPALANAEAMLSQLELVASAAPTSEQAITAIADWFASPSGFSATGYLGAAPLPPQALAAGGPSVAEPTAEHPALRRSLAALAIGALIDKPPFNSPGAETIRLRTGGLDAIAKAKDGVTDLSALIGIDQQRLEKSISQHQAESLSFEQAIANLISADPATTAVELESVRVNLETVYAVTARLSKLSLAEYLR